MRRRSFVTWFLLSVLLVGAWGSLGGLMLLAQEGALGGPVEEEVAGQREQAADPGPAVSAPEVIYEGEGVSTEDQKGRRWGNMNWFALYLVLAGPATYFVFRGVSR